MSSDLYTSQINDDIYGTLTAEMSVHGNLRMIAYDPGSRDLVASFNLPPTFEGWNEAENLMKALQEWILHTKEMQKDYEFLSGLTKGLDR
jgi:hypothetical protein